MSGGGWVPNMGLGTTITQLGRAAKDIGSSLESSLQNVAENLEGAFITFGQDTAERAGCVTRTSSFDSQGSGGVGGSRPFSPQHPLGRPCTSPILGEASGGGAEGSERERLVEEQSGAGSMGCGTSYDYRSSTEPTEQQAAASSNPRDNMICDMCGNKFGLINRKKLCCECNNYFCGNCLPREQGSSSRTCSRCRVLNKMPPIRGDLMKLRVKDLQHFLARRRINIKSCVEKKDLVELVLAHSGVSHVTHSSPPAGATSSTSWSDPTIRVSDQVPLERSGNFPKSYVESSHRRDWFQEKFGANSEEPAAAGSDNTEAGLESPVESTPVEIIDNEETLVERIGVETEIEDMDVDEVISVVVEEAGEDEKVQEISEEEVEELTSENDINNDAVEDINVGDEEESSDPASDEGAVGGQTEEETLAARLGPRLNVDLLADQVSLSTPSSPRRFAGQGMVYLSEIKSVDDLSELSTKQVKELLAMNRVNFKGCVEKEELMKIVERLWKQEQRQKDSVETMDDDAMCKICMDSPIDCVMLECGHMCTCTNCGKQMAECPICRQYVVRVVKTFKA